MTFVSHFFDSCLKFSCVYFLPSPKIYSLLGEIDLKNRMKMYPMQDYHNEKCTDEQPTFPDNLMNAEQVSLANRKSSSARGPSPSLIKVPMLL